MIRQVPVQVPEARSVLEPGSGRTVNSNRVVVNVMSGRRAGHKGSVLIPGK